MKPRIDDGLLEVVGVTGVVHMVRLVTAGSCSETETECVCVCVQGQVQSGMRSGIRIAQGNYIRLTLSKAVPVQVDGEPWVQPPGHVIISAAGPKVALFLLLPLFFWPQGGEEPRLCSCALASWLPCRQVRMLRKSKQKQRKSSASMKDKRSESPASRDGGGHRPPPPASTPVTSSK